MINLELIPLKPALLQGFDNETHVLFRASAEADPSLSDNRKPLNVAIAIDRSGSMSGPPLSEAKKCAIAMVERMSPPIALRSSPMTMTQRSWCPLLR